MMSDFNMEWKAWGLIRRGAWRGLCGVIGGATENNYVEIRRKVIPESRCIVEFGSTGNVEASSDRWTGESEIRGWSLRAGCLNGVTPVHWENFKKLEQVSEKFKRIEIQTVWRVPQHFTFWYKNVRTGELSGSVSFLLFHISLFSRPTSFVWVSWCNIRCLFHMLLFHDWLSKHDMLCSHMVSDPVMQLFSFLKRILRFCKQ